MPLLLRTVDPTHVSRGTLPDRFPVQNDLEAVSNGTLSNVIRQLSTLSHHAEELFTDLIGVASGIAHRAGNLQARIDRLAVRVGQIDSVQEESASIHESLNTKPFTSSLVFDQQVVSRTTLPPSMVRTFQICDKPPPLDKLNKYRDDGRNGLKFYTDPSYFFDLWRQEMLKDTERAIDRGKKPHKLKGDGQSRHKKRVRQPHNTRERQRHLAVQQGEHLMGGSVSPDFRNQSNSIGSESLDGSNLAYPTPPDGRASYSIQRGPSLEMDDSSNQREQMNNRAMLSMQQQHQRQQYEAYQRYYASQNQNYESPNYTRNNRNIPVNGYRPSQPPPAPPPSYIMGTPPQGTPPMHTPNNLNNVRMSASRSNHRDTLPPPPPPPTDLFPQPEEEDLPPPPPTPLEHGMLRPPNLSEDHLPPSPPPPPLDDTPAQAPPPPPPPPPGIPQMAQNGDAVHIVKTPKSRKNVSMELRDGRDELLKAIRDGIALRKVETTDGAKVEEKPSTYHDVASILARRVALEMSDSDSGSSEYDSDGWDEASA